MAILEISQGFNEGATFRLGQRSLTLGRETRNIVQIIDDRVSRRHAMIRWDGSGHILVDLQSHNGVYVNGKKVTESPLVLGDRLRVGNTELTMRSDDHLTEDATLAPKVVDKRIVGLETRALRLTEENKVQNSIEAGKTVEVDDFHAAQELVLQKLGYKLGRMLAQQKSSAEVQTKAADAIVEFLAPDRLLFLKLESGGKVSRLLSRFAEELAEKKRGVRAHGPALVAVVREGSAHLSNSVPPQFGEVFQIGSVLAIPVRQDDGNITGAVYMDSFSDSPQSFIDEDRGLVEHVIQAIRTTFV